MVVPVVVLTWPRGYGTVLACLLGGQLLAADIA
jgi:hypothetical protein